MNNSSAGERLAGAVDADDLSADESCRVGAEETDDARHFLGASVAIEGAGAIINWGAKTTLADTVASAPAQMSTTGDATGEGGQ